MACYRKNLTSYRNLNAITAIRQSFIFFIHNFLTLQHEGERCVYIYNGKG
jgi:hypothetical protein